jgi:chromosome segregation ATPase
MATIEENIKQLEETEKQLKEKTEELERTKATVQDYETKKNALELEHKRVLEQIEAARKEKEALKHKEELFSEKFRRENLQKVSQRIMKELDLKMEDFKPIEEAYNASKSDSISEDSIYRDMMAIYASQHAAELIAAQKRIKELELSAQQYSAQQSSGAGAGANFPNPIKEINLTPEDEQAARWAGVPLETYKRWKAEGKV